MPKPGRFSHFKKVSGSHIGRIAIKLYECCGCHTQYKGDKPAQCMACGRMDFRKIDSQTEANRLGELRLLLAANHISDLEIQVRFPLMAHRADGRGVKVGTYIADFVYQRDGAQVVEDTKSHGIIDPLAAWKLRHMEAQGMPVTIVTPKGKF